MKVYMNAAIWHKPNLLLPQCSKHCAGLVNHKRAVKDMTLMTTGESTVQVGRSALSHQDWFQIACLMEQINPCQAA